MTSISTSTIHGVLSAYGYRGGMLAIERLIQRNPDYLQWGIDEWERLGKSVARKLEQEKRAQGYVAWEFEPTDLDDFEIDMPDIKWLRARIETPLGDPRPMRDIWNYIIVDMPVNQVQALCSTTPAFAAFCRGPPSAYDRIYNARFGPVTEFAGGRIPERDLQDPAASLHRLQTAIMARSLIDNDSAKLELTGRPEIMAEGNRFVRITRSAYAKQMTVQVFVERADRPGDYSVSFDDQLSMQLYRQWKSIPAIQEIVPVEWIESIKYLVIPDTDVGKVETVIFYLLEDFTVFAGMELPPKPYYDNSEMLTNVMPVELLPLKPGQEDAAAAGPVGQVVGVTSAIDERLGQSMRRFFEQYPQMAGMHPHDVAAAYVRHAGDELTAARIEKIAAVLVGARGGPEGEDTDLKRRRRDVFSPGGQAEFEQLGLPPPDAFEALTDDEKFDLVKDMDASSIQLLIQQNAYFAEWSNGETDENPLSIWDRLTVHRYNGKIEGPFNGVTPLTRLRAHAVAFSVMETPGYVDIGNLWDVFNSRPMDSAYRVRLIFSKKDPSHVHVQYLYDPIVLRSTLDPDSRVKAERVDAARYQEMAYYMADAATDLWGDTTLLIEERDGVNVVIDHDYVLDVVYRTSIRFYNDRANGNLRDQARQGIIELVAFLLTNRRGKIVTSIGDDYYNYPDILKVL